MKLVAHLACLVTLAGGCTATGDLRDSTIESSVIQLQAAVESGYPTRIVAVDLPIDARKAVAEDADSRGDITYLVLTSNDAQIVWAESLRSRPPISQAAVIGRWVVPYLQFGDTDTALRAFVFGYLEAMHEAGSISWSSAIVPFLPPESKKESTSTTYGWGGAFALGTVILVVWSERRRGM